MIKRLSGDTTLRGKFNHFVVKKDGCWDWKGCCPKNPGYPQLRFGKEIVRAHRASWMIHKGIIPKGMMVLHKCDNRRCSNPDHLFLGTAKDNMKDACQKGRNKYFWANGEKNHQSVLTFNDVVFIKELIKMGVTTRSIADTTSQKLSTIGNIKQGYTWNNV